MKQVRMTMSVNDVGIVKSRKKKPNYKLNENHPCYLGNDTGLKNATVHALRLAEIPRMLGSTYAELTGPNSGDQVNPRNPFPFPFPLSLFLYQAS